MSKRTSLIAIIAILLLIVILLVFHRPTACNDPLGCITVSQEKPFEIGILYSPPGTTCEPAMLLLEALEQQAAVTAQQEKIPLAIIKEESGFDLASAQQALARLLVRPNLATVLILDCQFGNDPSLQKLISDAGLSARPIDSTAASLALSRTFDAFIERVNSLRNTKSNRFLLERSALKEQIQENIAP